MKMRKIWNMMKEMINNRICNLENRIMNYLMKDN